MTRFCGSCVLALVCSAGAIMSAQTSPVGTDAGIRIISLTRVIRIPVAQGAGKGEPGAVVISPGAADEPPEGPSGFDVLDDGSLLIADPLQQRVCLYDAQGRYRSSWNVGFAPDSVTASGEKTVLVRDANTGQLHAFDKDGREQHAQELVPPVQAQARLLDSKTGMVPAGAHGVSAGSPITVHFDEGAVLISLENLAGPNEGDIFVALESTRRAEAADAIDLQKSVRRYKQDGRLVSEILEIPLDYYVTPVDELRVHKGVVYQMATYSSELHINEWDTN